VTVSRLWIFSNPVSGALPLRCLPSPGVPAYARARNLDVKTHGYGLPLSCPACRAKGVYYGMLKVPGNKATPCPNCNSPLVASRRTIERPERDDHESGR